ncbi:oxidoreductase [Nitrogeniibacter mangrovi]|uniref:Oxidoreductase n=1 Tax=Nitrogeniibacter mangrovi TaxID=2016596 RepID=A0A6C1AY04_9RHOO|nr:PDR/VanB family oxidoreductase [Nitrogeniibacter mangrovi]QID16217.1 oxidoreductase [Nitrogeniibacter mangrovi]
MNAQTDLRLDARITRRTPLATDIVGLTVAAADGRPLPPAEAGAHIDLCLPNGLVRQYSIARQSEAGYELGILRDPASRGGSACVHETLVEGATLQISPPRNLFPLAADARRSLLFAGGIGITPIIAMADALHAAGADFELHYATRSRDRAAYLDRLATAPYADRVHCYHDDTPEAGRLDAAALLAHPQPGTHLYVCGPNGFMDHVIDRARAAGWAEADVHSERFAAPAIDTADDGSFAIEIASSGQTIQVAPEQSAIAALHAAGFDVPLSCEQGICGTCLTRVLDGEPDHRDMFLTEAERAANDRFTPCCSRGKGRLLLDL